MNNLLSILFALVAFNLCAQSFAPPAEQPGSTAIAYDSSAIVNWASGLIVNRGPMDIQNPQDGLASFGSIEDGKVAGGISTDVVSLGDGGVAIATFDQAIIDGPGPDFAIFENGFTDNYMEFAFVEVSSDGINYVRFPATSEYQNSTQVGAFEITDCRFYNNLAGKYRLGFGTPFDLNELQDSSGIDIENITHVRILDVVGSINPLYGREDQHGNLINDLFPTPFESSGFDLDGIAVIHQKSLEIKITEASNLSLFPNPTSGVININSISPIQQIEIYSTDGKQLDVLKLANHPNFKIDLKRYNESIILLKILTEKSIQTSKVLVK